MSTTVLIVDDDPVQRRLLEGMIIKFGYRTMVCEDGAQAVDLMAKRENHGIGLMVLDLMMPDMDGFEVLEKLREMALALPVIVQTSQGGIDTVVKAIRAGAVDFCAKPVSPERLKVSIQNALKLGAMEETVARIQKSHSGKLTFKDMIAESPAMQSVVRLGMRAADSNIPVLIEGESGVGKEVIAKAIQGESERAGQPFVAVNCGALPENLVESILFGHEKGAFTGAVSRHVGKFKEADGGTLFLDEVGELSLDIQVKLLRAIQEGEIDPVGSNKPVKTDFRLISATNRDMIEQVQSGAFREDLYYRLNVFPIQVPGLRARKTDIAALVRHFIAKISLEEGRRNVEGISNDALAMLECYDWPGNIRQLENTLFRAIILNDGGPLTIHEFPQIAQAMDGTFDHGDSPRAVLDAPSIEPQISHGDPVGHSLVAPAQSPWWLNEQKAVRPLCDIEEEVIAEALKHHKGRMTAVANALGIGRSTLYRKIKEYGLEEPSASS